jgi:virginiamycin B lyase
VEDLKMDTTSTTNRARRAREPSRGARTDHARYAARVRRRPCLESLEGRALLSGVVEKLAPVAEFPLPHPDSSPVGITAGSGGSLWFTEATGDRIGRITTDGTLTEYALPQAESWPYDIAAMPDGTLWFTESTGHRIGHITAAGAISEYAMPKADSDPFGITVGPGGAPWFTENWGNRVGQLLLFTDDYFVSEYDLPKDRSFPGGITVGPDGALWFAETGNNRIGRITTDGTLTEYPLPDEYSYPRWIAVGPDGALWFTEDFADRIGRITIGGAITEYNMPTANSEPERIAVGPDGALWFTELEGERIGRITTDGGITEYPVPDDAGSLLGITVGPDGALWFTENYGNRIGRLDPPPDLVAGPMIAATVGTPFDGTVATFHDNGGLQDPTGYRASIDWGDGTSSTGLIARGARGEYFVSGQHTYRSPASDPVEVWVRDAAGNLVSDATTASVGVPAQPIAIQVQPMTAVEGQAIPAGTVLSTFTNPTGFPIPANATIDWGDGSPPESADVVDAEPYYSVVTTDAHTYAASGTPTLRVTIAEAKVREGDPGPIVLAMGSAPVQVVDAPLTPLEVPTLTVAKGTWSSQLLVGSFQDANPSAQPRDFTATIDWGDGTAPSTGLVAQPSGPGTDFRVLGGHEFLAETASPRPVFVHLRNEEGREVTLTAGVQINDAVPILAAIPVKMTKNNYFDAALANIFEPNGSRPDAAGQYTATIDWGDGTGTTTGQVVATAGGYYQVLGGHTYKKVGPYTVTITVNDPDAGTVTTTTTIFDPPAHARRRVNRPSRKSSPRATPRGPLELPGASRRMHPRLRATETPTVRMSSR